MILSRNWLNDFVNTDGISDKEYCDRMTDTGSKVECYEVLGEDIENVVVAKVTAMEKHPDSDHLWICQLDAGKGEDIQIVTGAQNVFVGALVPAALAPAKLPGGVNIKAGKLRGVASNGMMCSLGELGLTVHDMPETIEDGIAILGTDGYEIGSDIRDALLLRDTAVEFEITSNRPDCLSVIGLARETAASFDKELCVKAPEVKYADGDINDYLKVSISAPELCYRYAARVVKNVKIEPSPMWLRARLRASGVRPINNIVDITNYVMLEYGQPMHAFDYSCIDGSSIVVRRANDAENFRSLDSNDHTLSSNDLVIADSKKAVALAGVMGGENSEIKDDTKTVVFESACFMGSSVRVSAKSQGMRTESSGRFEKGLDPENCMPALDRACELVNMLGAGEVVCGTIDEYPGKKDTTVLDFECERYNEFLGTDISAEKMTEILLSLGFGISEGKITVPSWRADCGCMNDIAEEVVRIYGYNTIRSTNLRGETTTGGRTKKQLCELSVHDAMCASGYNEIATFSFISPKYYDKIALAPDSTLRRSVVISNPLGEDTSVMRTTALPSLLEVLCRNNNFSNENVKLYELATVYLPKDGDNELPDERKSLVFGFYGEGDFYYLKATVGALLSSLRITDAKYEACGTNPSYHPGRCAVVSIKDKEIGVIGQIHPTVAQKYGFSAKSPVYAAQIDFDTLFEFVPGDPAYKPLPKFPASTRDFSFVCDDSLEVGKIEQAMKDAKVKILEDVKLFDIYRGEQVGEGKKSVSFRVSLRLSDRTITDEEADKAVAKLLRSIETALGIKVRD